MEQKYFHSGFVSAMKLELFADADMLDFQSGFSALHDKITFDLMISTKGKTDHFRVPE